MVLLSQNGHVLDVRPDGRAAHRRDDGLLGEPCGVKIGGLRISEPSWPCRVQGGDLPTVSTGPNFPIFQVQKGGPTQAPSWYWSGSERIATALLGSTECRVLAFRG
eukprot:1179836-Prorocentrum_minimum.AAC.3